MNMLTRDLRHELDLLWSVPCPLRCVPARAATIRLLRPLMFGSSPEQLHCMLMSRRHLFTFWLAGSAQRPLLCACAPPD